MTLLEYLILSSKKCLEKPVLTNRSCLVSSASFCTCLCCWCQCCDGDDDKSTRYRQNRRDIQYLNSSPSNQAGRATSSRTSALISDTMNRYDINSFLSLSLSL
jgi:hypothetical protein